MALFDNAKSFVPSMLECVTNPCWWDIEGVKVFGTSGQGVDDVYKYVDDDHIEGGRVGLLEKMLRWRHCAPTAPDTLCTLFFYVEGTDCRVLSVSRSRSLCVGGNTTYFLCWKSA